MSKHIQSPLWQKWCYNGKQNLSFIELSELYKSNSHGVLAPESVHINSIAKSHAGGPLVQP